MLLRIEDIDEPRVVPGAAELMMDDLHWLGLDWDGDPVFQSLGTTCTVRRRIAWKPDD